MKVEYSYNGDKLVIFLMWIVGRWNSNFNFLIMKRGKTITWLENYKKLLSHQFKINRKRTETLEHHKSTTMSYKFLKVRTIHKFS